MEASSFLNQFQLFNLESCLKNVNYSGMMLKRLILLWWLSLSLCFPPSFWPQWRSSVLMEAWWATGGKIPVIRSLVSPCFSSACHKTALVIIFVPISLPLTFKDQPLNSKPHSYSVHHPLEGHQNHYPLQESSSSPYSAFKGSRHRCTVRNASYETLRTGVIERLFL